MRVAQPTQIRTRTRFARKKLGIEAALWWSRLSAVATRILQCSPAVVSVQIPDTEHLDASLWLYSPPKKGTASLLLLAACVQGGVMCAERMVCGAIIQVLLCGSFFRKYVMIGASELAVKTYCQLWEDSDTPPVLKEFRSEQNQQRIDTLIIQASRHFIIAIPVKWARPTMQGTAATCH